MPAGIYEKDSMASVREVPWHRLGTILPDSVTLEEMVKLAGLEWRVGFRDLQTTEGKPVTMRRAVVREDTGDVLGVVGGRYTPVQNNEAADFLAKVLDTGEASAETAGSLYNGRKVWFQAKLGTDIRVGGTDPIDPYIVIANTHDGSAPLIVAITPVRVVCQNTLSAGLTAAKRTFRIAHTKSIEGKVVEARKALDMSYAYFGEFTSLMEQLAEQSFGHDDVVRLVSGLFPELNPNKSSEEEREKQAARRLSLISLYYKSPTVDRGTAYGAYNAVTEWFDHIKNGYRGEYKADRKADAILFGDGVEFKDRALALITGGAK